MRHGRASHPSTRNELNDNLHETGIWNSFAYKEARGLGMTPVTFSFMYLFELFRPRQVTSDFPLLLLWDFIDLRKVRCVS